MMRIFLRICSIRFLFVEQVFGNFPGGPYFPDISQTPLVFSWYVPGIGLLGGGGAGESVIGPSLVRSGQVLIEISKYSNA